MLPNEKLHLPAVGEAVTLTGTTASGDLFPTIRATDYTHDGRPGLPAAREITFEQGMNEAPEAQWVEISGQLRQVRASGNWLSLTIGTTTGEFPVSIPSVDRMTIPIGSFVHVKGVFSIWKEIPTAKTISGFYLFTPTLDQVQEYTPAANGTLTLVSQIQRLYADEARSARAVLLHGVVTFSHPDQRLFYLNDSTAGILVWLEDRSIRLPVAGESVAVIGQTSMGAFTATVHGSRISVEGTRPLPVPKSIDLELARTGAEDGQWVEMRGQLVQVEPHGDWLRLSLTSGAGDYAVNILHAATTDIPVGSFLVARGVCQSWVNEKGLIGGVFLNSPSLNQIEVTEPPLADPFLAHEVSIPNLKQFRTQSLRQQQVLVRGTVLFHEPGRSVVVENTGGVVRAMIQGKAPLRPGDRVEVVGVPGHEGNHSVLRGAVYRKTGSGEPPAPLSPSGGLILDPALDGRLVSVTGTLVNLLHRREDTRLLVQARDAVTEIVYQGELPESVSAAWEPGSLVNVVGLYTVESDDNDQPANFVLQLRQASDVVVRATRPWWTVRRALTGLALIAAFLGLGLVWVAALRRRVAKQTDVIRLQLEKEARLEARYGEIIANASDLIFTTDLEGRFTSFNPAGERLTGYALAAALKLTLHQLLATEDSGIASALLAVAQSPEQPHPARFEARVHTPDGRLVWLETSARIIREAGRPAGLLGIARDITDRKLAEEKHRELEQLNHQLAKAESLGRMASAVAHHFNNQLQAVTMGLEAAQGEAADIGMQSDSIATALLSARKAADMSKLMLTYLGHSHAVRETLDLSEVCVRALGQLRPLLPSQVTVDQLIPLPGPKLTANAKQIQQCFSNLVLNASESFNHSQGVVRVRITTVAVSEIPPIHRFPVDGQLRDCQHACLEVADTGCGIPPENIEKIFDPFFSSKFPGRGMGLAVTLSIVRTHDGAITVTSQAGRGSVFRVFLPLAAAPGL